MAEVTRSIYFYQVKMHEGEWKREEVLEDLSQLTGDARLLDLGDENYAWAKVDRIPKGQETGRVRFFRDRRANLPGMSQGADVSELTIPDDAGLVEPTHVVLGGDGLIAAEYNHFAPRITSAFAYLLRQKLGYDLTIGTYVQGDIIEQLDRLEHVQLLEWSVLPTPSVEAELRNAGTFGAAAAALCQVEDGKRVYLRLSGDKNSPSWGDEVKAFVKHLMGMPEQEQVTKVLRVTGLDPASENVEAIDLLRQKLVRRVDIERSSQRCKALDVTSAYGHIESSIAEVRAGDLKTARVIE